MPRLTHTTARHGVAVLAGAAALAAFGLTAAPASAAWTNEGGTCSSTFRAYDYKTSCLAGSYWERVHSGSYDETFAIRGDHEVIHASPGHSWAPVSNGKADYVKDVYPVSGGRAVCVERRSDGHVWQSVYQTSTRRWSSFSVGCDL